MQVEIDRTRISTVEDINKLMRDLPCSLDAELAARILIALADLRVMLKAIETNDLPTNG